MNKNRRGIGTYSTLFGEEATVAEKKKGRDAELVALRDVCLYHRYYYYIRIHRLLLEQVMEELSREFFLSTDTIPRIIDCYVTELQQLKNSNPDISSFKKKYPHLVWKENY